MDIYKLKFTKLGLEILSLLSIKSGKSLSQRKIALLLKVSPTAVGKTIPKLGDYIIKEEQDRTNYISLNTSKREVIAYKRTENLRFIYSSGLALFLEESYPGCTIILFGSYSRGDDTITSDIDIAVIGAKEKNINLNRFEHLLERKIIVNHYHSLKQVHQHLRENILNGITLAGGIEL